MNPRVAGLIFLAAGGPLACASDDLDPDTRPEDCTSNAVLVQADIQCDSGACQVPAGQYVGAITFDVENTYTLMGNVLIGDGSGACSGQLTIAPGTRVLGSAEHNGLLAILPNSTLTADGSATEPILFTSDAPAPTAGDWGGVALLGNAIVNCGGRSTSCTAVANTGEYGANDDNDSSGSMSFVRIEFAGAAVDAGRPLPGLSLQGVGLQTSLRNIHIHKSRGDGLVFFGGRVNAREILVTGVQGDSLKWTYGWRGRMEFGVIQHHPGESRHSIVGENNSFDPTALLRSSPILSNITLVGQTNMTGTGTIASIRLAEGTGGQLWNLVATGFPSDRPVLDIDSPETFAHASANSGNLVIAHSVFCSSNNFEDEPNEPFTATNFFTTGMTFGSINNTARASCDSDYGTGLTDIVLPNFTPVSGSALGTGGGMPLDNFFSMNAFQGALAPGNTTPWYSWTSF